MRQAAAELDVTPGTLSELERGLRHPHDVTLAKIAKGYSVPVEELLEEPVPLGEAPEAGQSEEERGEGHIAKLSGRSVTRSEARGELTIITEALRELDEWFDALEPRIQQEVGEEVKTIHRKLASREHA